MKRFRARLKMVAPTELWILALSSGLLIGASTALWRTRRLAVTVSPVPSGKLRIRGPQGLYRTRFVGVEAAGWLIQAPIQRDHYVPLRPGEPLTIEAPTPNGVLRFRSIILSRDPHTHTLMVAPPRHASVDERRQHPRFEEFLDVETEFGATQTLDLGAGGLRLAGRYGQVGEVLMLCLPEWDLSVSARVLAHEAGSTRLRWEPESATTAASYLPIKQRSRKSWSLA